MNRLIPHIEYLLQDHDCVVLPGLGAVLAHGYPAFYDEETNVWMPPKRVLSFNTELSRNDGLLASSVSRKESISQSSATTVVNNEVSAMRRKLESDRHLSLGAVGSLSSDDEGFLSFIPGNIEWISPSTLWLPQFAMSELDEAGAYSEGLNREFRHNRWQSIARRASQVAASIAVLFVLGWIVAQNMSYVPSNQIACIAPVQTPTVVSDEPSPAQTVLILAQAPKDEVIENIPVENNVKCMSDFSEEDRYFLIVASFASEKEAQEFIKQHNDINLGILNAGGRNRVYAAKGKTFAEAASAQGDEAISSRFSSSWVCRR